GLSCPIRPLRPPPGSRWHGPCAPPLFPRGIPGAPAHTHESSPVLRSVAPLPSAAPPVAANFCRRGKRLRPGWVLSHSEARILLRWLPECIHRQKQKAAGRAVAPLHRAAGSSRRGCCATSAAVAAHPVTHWSRWRGGSPTGQAKLAGRTASFALLLTRW